MGAPAAALGDPPAGLVAALRPDVNRIGECVAHVVGQAGAGRLGDDHPQQVVAAIAKSAKISPAGLCGYFLATARKVAR